MEFSLSFEAAPPLPAPSPHPLHEHAAAQLVAERLADRLRTAQSVLGLVWFTTDRAAGVRFNLVAPDAAGAVVRGTDYVHEALRATGATGFRLERIEVEPAEEAAEAEEVPV